VHSVAPDQAMSLLFPQGADVSAATVGGASREGSSGTPPEGPPEPSDIMVRLAACLDLVGGASRRLADAMERQRLREELQWEDCHPIDLAPVSIAGAGSLTDERWQPRAGFAWQILLVTVTFGAGATEAVMYKSADASGATPNNALNGFTPNAVTSIGVWEPKGLIFLPGQQALFAATGGGITVRGEAVEIALGQLPPYLM
jgi:hypothetical protein